MNPETKSTAPVSLARHYGHSSVEMTLRYLARDKIAKSKAQKKVQRTLNSSKRNKPPQ